MMNSQLSSPLSVEQQRVIRRAALAERRYWKLVKQLEEFPAARRAVLEARVRVDAELRAPAVRTEPDLSESIDVAVDREIARQRPVIRQLLAARRAARREGATGCGLVQLELSRSALLRRHLSSVVHHSGLFQWQIAEAVGASHRHIERLLSSPRRAARSRRSWISRLESLTFVDGYYCIVVRPGAARRRQWQSLSASEKDAEHRNAGLTRGQPLTPDSEELAASERRQREARAITAAVHDRTRQRQRSARTVGGAVAKRIQKAAELQRLIAWLLRHGPRDRAEIVAAVRRAGFSERQLLRNGQALELRYLRVGIKGSRGGGKCVIALPSHLASRSFELTTVPPLSAFLARVGAPP